MSKCEQCSCHSSEYELERLPEGSWDYAIALAGNPNTGKSTVFNGLTGLRQHTGNWPGKTVTRAEGLYEHEGKNYKLVDLPGTYSLLSASQDEEIARNFILFGQPDCTVVITDATVLERNLNLVLQVLEISEKVIVCLNCIDEAERKGIEINVALLEEELGVPVVATAASSKRGLEELRGKIGLVVQGKIATKPRRAKDNTEWSKAVDELVPLIEEAAPGVPNPRWVAMRLIEGDDRMRRALVTGELAQLAQRQQDEAEKFSSKIALEGNQ